MSAAVTSVTRWSGALSAQFDDAVDVVLMRRRPAWPLAIMRVLFGLTLMGWTVTMAFDAEDLLGSNALVPQRFETQGRWNWFDLGSSTAVWIALGALLLASLAITLGWRPTEWLVLSFLLLVAVQRRNPVILNSGDLLIRDMALILAFSPTGAALSIDRWRRFGKQALRTAPMVAPWGLRLIQLQIMIVYFFAFWSKSGDLWKSGTAVSTAVRLEDLQRFAAPDWLVSNIVIIAVFTWGTLIAELALSMFLWVKRLRPVLIVVGYALHFFIDVFMLVGFFGPLMMTGLLAFSNAEWIDGVIKRRFGSSGAERVETKGDRSSRRAEGKRAGRTVEA